MEEDGSVEWKQDGVREEIGRFLLDTERASSV